MKAHDKVLYGLSQLAPTAEIQTTPAPEGAPRRYMSWVEAQAHVTKRSRVLCVGVPYEGFYDQRIHAAAQMAIALRADCITVLAEELDVMTGQVRIFFQGEECQPHPSGLLFFQGE